MAKNNYSLIGNLFYSPIQMTRLIINNLKPCLEQFTVHITEIIQTVYDHKFISLFCIAQKCHNFLQQHDTHNTRDGRFV